MIMSSWLIVLAYAPSPAHTSTTCTTTSTQNTPPPSTDPAFSTSGTTTLDWDYKRRHIDIRIRRPCPYPFQYYPFDIWPQQSPHICAHIIQYGSTTQLTDPIGPPSAASTQSRISSAPYTLVALKTNGSQESKATKHIANAVTTTSAHILTSL